MTIQDSVGVYNTAEFADNPEARCSIVLILDVSGSMAGAPIDTVNRALVKFRDIIREDSVTALRADVAVIAFDNEARVIQDFTNGTDFEAPVLEVSGGTNYSKAVNLALDLIEARKQSYRDGGIAYYRSLAYFLTDGCPQEDDPAALAQTARRLAQVEENRGIAFFSFVISNGVESLIHMDKLAELLGIGWEEFARMVVFGESITPDIPGSVDFDWDTLGNLVDLSGSDLYARCLAQGVIQTPMGELAKLAPRPPKELENMQQLDGAIQWMSRSVAAVSQSQPGDSIRLPEPDYLNF